MTFCPLTFTCLVFIPKEENSRISPFFTLIVYLPSKSVETPWVVPLMSTETPGKGLLETSVTFPVTSYSCA